jgi:hypothetical protein
VLDQFFDLFESVSASGDLLWFSIDGMEVFVHRGVERSVIGHLQSLASGGLAG